MTEKTIGSEDEASISIGTFGGTWRGASFPGDFEGQVNY
jgi:hypothetical protein